MGFFEPVEFYGCENETDTCIVANARIQPLLAAMEIMQEALGKIEGEISYADIASEAFEMRNVARNALIAAKKLREE